jgi:hypothetical protein
VEALSRSWTLTKLSFRVIGQDKELLLFPLIAMVLSIGYLLALLYPTIWLEMSRDGSLEWSVADIIITFLAYLGLAFIGTFMNVCIVFTAKTRFEGGDATFGQSIGFALGRIHLILGWAVVSATVGVIMNMIDNAAQRLGGIGEIVVSILRSILGVVWTVITIFVVPSMVYRGSGPITAIKDSIGVLKQTWGENLVRALGFGLVRFVFLFLGALAFGGLFSVVASAGGTAILVVSIAAITYFIAVVFTFMLAEMIFDTALYAWASMGKVPPGYDQDLLQGAVRTK